MTGWDRRACEASLMLVAIQLAERGGTIESVQVESYDGETSYLTSLGKVKVKNSGFGYSPDDTEGDFITRIRKVIGNKTFISTSMDLHGNVSKILAEKTDLIWSSKFTDSDWNQSSNTQEAALKKVVQQNSLRQLREFSVSKAEGYLNLGSQRAKFPEE